jgi:hypothetical protein|tara:strand:- start:23 stop:229 length:207 start_codon:yes stop_codon:yes gene_type:complete
MNNKMEKEKLLEELESLKSLSNSGQLVHDAITNDGVVFAALAGTLENRLVTINQYVTTLIDKVKNSED